MGILGHALIAMIMIAPGAYGQLNFLQVIPQMMAVVRSRFLGRKIGVVY